MSVVDIKLDNLKIHPKNVRRKYEGIEELARSIKENGIMQNLTVVPDKEEEGKYLVVIGNRRLTAAREAGLETAPCVVVEDMAEKEQITTMLMENMNRKDLTVYEEAEAMQMCFEDFGLKVEEIEEKTGLSKTTINHRLNMAKILKEASDSRDLANKARYAARQELLERNKAKLLEECEKLGINKAPEGVYYYSSGWEEVERIYLDVEDSKIEMKEAEGVYYVIMYNSFSFIKKEKKQKKKKEVSAVDLKQKEIKEKRAKIEAKLNEMLKDMEDFVRNILEGKLEPPDNAEYIGKLTWEFLTKHTATVTQNTIAKILLGKDTYRAADEEETAKALEKAKVLPILYQMIAVAFNELEYLNLIRYVGTEYQKSSGDKLKEMHDILGMFGFSFADEESYQIMSGEHELYEKEDK